MVDETRTGEHERLRPLSDVSEADVWAMVDASPDGMLLVDEWGTILFVNSQAEHLFGYDRGELLGQPVEVLLPVRFRLRHAAHRTRFRVEPSTRAMGSGLDLVAACKSGAELPVEISLSPVRTGTELRVVATVRDVTQRRTIEAHAHAVLHTIDAAHDGVFMFSPDTLRFSYVNQGAVSQLGYSAEELLAMTPLHIKPEFTERAFRELLAPLIDGQRDSHTFTTVHRRKDGSDVPVEIILEYPPATEPNQARLLVALVRDITTRLHSEQAARTQQARVQMFEDRERLARDLHDVVIQRLFAAGLGLQAIQPLTENPVVKDRLDDTIEQLDQTITDLRSAIFDLTTDTGTTTDRIQGHLDQSVIGLGHVPSLRITGDPASISAHVVDELVATLNEALSNIARHAQATTTDVTLDIGTDTIVLTVTDNGIGIDPAAPRGNGLTNVEARADRLAGAASITSDATGTTLTWTATLT